MKTAQVQEQNPAHIMPETSFSADFGAGNANTGKRPLESIERAIRNAFAKADAHNPATRQRIYESAWGAHERALAANAALGDAQKEQRRQKLKDAISDIEQEFSVSRHEARDEQGRTKLSVDAPQKDDPEFSDIAADSAPALDNGDIRSAAGKRKRASADLGYEGGVSRKEKRRKKRHSPFYSYGIPALVLFVAVAIGYSLYNSFLDLSRGPSSNPLHDDASMAPLKDGEEPGGVRWITIFQPTDAVRMSVQGRATAEIMRDGTRSFARIKSSGASDTITFDVGEGILDQLAGKKATFDIIAKADDGKTTQMSVNCDFAGFGDCGRRRYDVSESPSDFLFDMDFPSGKKAGGAGAITVNSDLNGTGKPVDIYEIRVSSVTQ